LGRNESSQCELWLSVFIVVRRWGIDHVGHSSKRINSCLSDFKYYTNARWHVEIVTGYIIFLWLKCSVFIYVFFLTMDTKVHIVLVCLNTRITSS
jgi:hypothetical protein